MLVATHLGADQGILDALAVSWIVLRVLYGALYMADQASLRSLVWLTALVVVLAMFLISV